MIILASWFALVGRGAGVAVVAGFAISIIIASAQMGCAHGLRVGTILISSTSRTESIDRICVKLITIIASTPEAVIMGLITDQIAPTISIHKTDVRDTEAIVTLLSGLAICILQTLASVVRHVTDGGGVGTVIVAVTTFTASVCVAGTVTYAAIEAVIPM